jgi:hypothetical protein
MGSIGAVKRHSKNDFAHHPTPHTMLPIHHGIWKSYLKWASRLPWGLPLLKDQRQNPLIGSEAPKATRARDEATQMIASNWRTRCPIEGTQPTKASYLSLDREVSFTPSTCGLALSRPGFLLGLPRKEA